MGCCNSPGWQKLGNKKTFLIILVHIGLIHGAIETYFRISAKQAARYFDYDPVIVGKNPLIFRLIIYVKSFYFNRLALGWQWTLSRGICLNSCLLWQSNPPCCLVGWNFDVSIHLVSFSNNSNFSKPVRL